jgi:anti-sigma regulatory factor (Ser/Thr protein kinase)
VQFEATFPAVPSSVCPIRREMVALARACGLDEQAVSDVALAVSEAATNAVVHACAGGAGTLTVRARSGGGELTIVIGDDGPGLLPRPDSPGLGLGLPIIATVARRMEVVAEGSGTQIHMTFGCPHEEAA